MKGQSFPFSLFLSLLLPLFLSLSSPPPCIFIKGVNLIFRACVFFISITVFWNVRRTPSRKWSWYKRVDSDQPLHTAILLQLDCFWVGKRECQILGEEKKGEKGKGMKGRCKQVFSSLHSLSDQAQLELSAVKSLPPLFWSLRKGILNEDSLGNEDTSCRKSNVVLQLRVCSRDIIWQHESWWN